MFFLFFLKITFNISTSKLFFIYKIMLFLILRQVMIFFFIEKMKTMLESMVKKNA